MPTPGIGGPLSGPMAKVLAASSYSPDQRSGLVNQVMSKMGLSLEAITVYVAKEAETGKVGALPAAQQQAAGIFTKLNQLSDRSLALLNKEVGTSKRPYMQDFLRAPANNVQMANQELEKLIILNKNVESKFMSPMGSPTFHALSGQLSQAAEAMISGGVPPNMIAQSLNLIKKNKDYDTGSVLLSGITGLRGAAAKSYANKHLTTSNINDFYSSHQGGMDMNSLDFMSKRTRLRQSKNNFLRELKNDPSTSDEDKAVLSNWVDESITNETGMNELSAAFKGGGMPGVRAAQTNIIKSMQTADQRKLTFAQAVDRYAFMKTTRGSTHATIGLLRGMKEGFVAPEVGLALLAAGGVQKGIDIAKDYIPNQIIGNLALGGPTNPVTGLIPGSGKNLRALSAFGGQNNLLSSYMFALAQGRSPGDIIKSLQGYKLTGLADEKAQQLQAFFTSGIMGGTGFLPGEAAQQLSGQMLTRGEIGPNTNLGLLSQNLGRANPQTNPNNYALTMSGVGGMANKWGNVLAMGLMSGMNPDDIATQAQNGGNTKIIQAGLKPLLRGMPQWMQASVLEGFGVSNPLTTAAQLANPGSSSGDGNLNTNLAFNAIHAVSSSPAFGANEIKYGIGRNMDNSGIDKSDYEGFAKALAQQIPGIADMSPQDLANAVVTQNPREFPGDKTQVISGLEKGFASAKAEKTGRDGSSAANAIYTINVNAPSPSSRDTGTSQTSAFRNGNR